MEKRRKEQLLQLATRAYRAWQKEIDLDSEVDDIEDMVQKISKALAFGTIISSGRNNLAAYIGQYRQCMDLKGTYDGRIKPLGNVWCWIGYADIKDIDTMVKNPNKNLVINVPERDLAETVLNIGDIASMDIKYGQEHNGRTLYIGSFKVCCLLRGKYDGKIAKLYNHWHWIGKAGFADISAVCNKYHHKNCRFNRKRIILREI